MEKILIIEDNAEIRENTEELLLLNNYTVLVAENGRAGFELAKSYQPDLILCDMMMPETDGSFFLKLAKEDDTVRNIPLIFFSAGSFCPEVQRNLIKGANEYLQKPFTKEELLITIKKGLDTKNSNVNVTPSSVDLSNENDNMLMK
ncbi:response regulator [Segetibacter koreensis]|uniref:response regulator n=1 Tax=Segetibacter koreensis TaxID=398037 RepID=UPI00036CCD39|nr:response regulator [Segetibacter koreensis]